MADQGYDNADDAAAAALAALAQLPKADAQEYMTLLVKDPALGKIFREAFQTQGRRDTSSWTGRPGGQIVGLVHGHPAERTGDKYPGTIFSPTDVSMAIKFGVPSYIAAMQADGLPQDRKYEPRKSHAGMHKQGQEFLAQFPIEELIAHIDQRNAFAQAAALARKQNPMLAAVGQ